VSSITVNIKTWAVKRNLTLKNVSTLISIFDDILQSLFVCIHKLYRVSS
jgi:hypothetical protein